MITSDKDNIMTEETMQHLTKREIFMLARVLKAFEDMGAEPEQLVESANDLKSMPSQIYVWYFTIRGAS